MALNKSIEYDWTPAICAVGDLPTLRSRFANVSMLSQIFGPLIAAALFIGAGFFRGYIVVAVIIFVQFIPQIILLRLVQNDR